MATGMAGSTETHDCKELSKLGMAAPMKDIRKYLDFGTLQ